MCPIKYLPKDKYQKEQKARYIFDSTMSPTLNRVRTIYNEIFYDTIGVLQDEFLNQGKKDIDSTSHDRVIFKFLLQNSVEFTIIDLLIEKTYQEYIYFLKNKTKVRGSVNRELYDKTYKDILAHLYYYKIAKSDFVDKGYSLDDFTLLSLDRMQNIVDLLVSMRKANKETEKFEEIKPEYLFEKFSLDKLNCLSTFMESLSYKLSDPLAPEEGKCKLDKRAEEGYYQTLNEIIKLLNEYKKSLKEKSRGRS